MNSRDGNRQNGQALVQVAMLMVVFLLVLALAIDAGLLFQRRRQMQNAADSGALAGARELCFGTGDAGQAMAQARLYAVQNGADDPPLVTIENWIVTVTTDSTFNTIFGGIAGIDEIEVHADAAAACGAANSGCGLWPVGFPTWRWEELKQAPCGTPFYVWAGDNENNNPDCELYDCDVNDDGWNDIVDMQGRAWLDFSDVIDPEYPDECTQAGCGAQELKCLIQNGEGGRITLPQCIAGDPGVRAGIRLAVESRIGDDVALPVYDGLGCAAGGTCPGSSIWAVDFACITVVGWEQGLELPRLDGDPPPWKDKVIAAAVSCDECETFCGGTPGLPPIPGGLNAVSLIE